MPKQAISAVPEACPLTLSESIAACEFSSVHRDINERNFPRLADPVADISDMLTVSQKDLGGEKMTPEEIDAAINRDGYRSAIIAEQLVYARKRWNGRDWVAALGSCWVDPDGYRHIPLLCGKENGRNLSLDWDGIVFRWLGVDLFLVVRLQSLRLVN